MAIHGVLSAIITPFTSDGEGIDEAALRRMVDQGIADGVHGFVPAGGTGEFSVLSREERNRVIQIVAEQVAGRVEVIAGIGDTSSRGAAAYAREAEKAGATAVMLATPYYDSIGEKEAFAYYTTVADGTGLPICAYNYPPATGFHLGVDFLLKLAAEIPQVRYVKDSSADILQMNTLIANHADKITFFIGEDVLLLQAAVLKVQGMIMGTANFMTPALRKIYDASHADDFATVVSVWQQITPVIRMLASNRYNSGVKAACNILGLPGGDLRAPIRSYSDAETEALRLALSKITPDLLTGASR